MKKQILLVGGHDKTRSLARSFLKKGYRVTAVNRDRGDCAALAGIERLRVIQGDGTKPYVLEDAGAGECDIAIALTKRDDENLVICELCKKRFGVKKTVALVNDPQKTEFFYSMGIDSVVCAVSVIANIIEQQAFIDEFASIVPIGTGQIHVAEIPIAASAPSAGKRLSEIALPKESIIGCIQRREQTIIPRGDTCILAGDVLVVISTPECEMAIVKELTGR